MQFEMTSGGERVSFTTHASKFPSGKNANFAERKVRTVLLPENPLFAPQLCIRVGVLPADVLHPYVEACLFQRLLTASVSH